MNWDRVIPIGNSAPISIAKAAPIVSRSGARGMRTHARRCSARSRVRGVRSNQGCVVTERGVDGTARLSRLVS